MSELQPQRFGRYLLIDKLSVGGMAEVYLAKAAGAQGFEKILAIKRILPTVSEDEDFRTMFVDEAQISARLNHVNIAQVFEFGESEGNYFIAMEYIPGQDVRRIVQHLCPLGRTMPVAMALHVVARICQALDYAHNQKTPDGRSLEIIHRDVSPPNVIISYDGEVKLIDFGIARAASRLTRTRAGKLKGKFAYISPEQIDGRPLDHRADIFSVGILLYEMLTNTRPFEGATQLETLNLVRKANPAPPSTINAEVALEIDRIVMRALAKDREQRYGRASDLRTDIERHVARAGTMMETHQLAEWMRVTFADRLREQHALMQKVNNLRVDDFTGGRLPPRPEPPATPLPRTTSGELRPQATPSAERDNSGPLFDEPPVDGWDSEFGAVSDGPAQRIGPPMDDPASYEIDVTGETVVDQHQQQQVAPTLPEIPSKEDLGGDAAHPPQPASTMVGAVENYIDVGSGSLQPSMLYEESSGDFADRAPPAGPAPSLSAEGERPVRVAPVDPYEHDAAPSEVYDHELAEHSGDDELENEPTRAQVVGEIAAPDRPPVPRGDPSGPLVASPLHADPRFEYTDRSEPPPGIVEDTGLFERIRHSLARLGSTAIIIIVTVFSLLLFVAAMWAFERLRPAAPPPAPATGSIVVTTDPPADCTVSVGGKIKRLMSSGGTLGISGVDVGAHHVALTCAGFRPFAATIDVKSAQVTVIEAALKRE